MPLPTDKGQWPPADVKPYVDQATAAAAWWSGDVEALKATSDAGGTTGRRRFWQRRQTNDKTKATSHLHAPLAGDIAAVSAELLFGDEIGLNTDDVKAQEALEALEDAIGLDNRLLEGAELAAATGGVYLRAAWDTTIADHPLSEVIPQTHAVPDFKYGQLVAVTLWKDVYTEGKDVWRLLERHEKGVVLSGLYQGTQTELGTPAPLTEHPDTAAILPEVVLPGRLKGRLLVSYVPNVLPNRRFTTKPIGRADIVGAEDFLDALDEAWTSLMRDIRLGQARVFVPEEWLKATGTRPGQQATLDMDTEIFTSLNMADSQEQKLDNYQPELRVEEHVETCLALTERIVSAAGYSPQTFGLHIDGNAQSGTALRIRAGKTDKTVSKKQRYWTPAIAQHVGLLLDIGAEVFKTPTIADPVKNPVKVEFPEVQMDPVDLATMVSTLRTAQAMSIESAVRLAQPDLEDKEVGEEVARIRDETSMADPMSLGIVPPEQPEDLSNVGPDD